MVLFKCKITLLWLLFVLVSCRNVPWLNKVFTLTTDLSVLYRSVSSQRHAVSLIKTHSLANFFHSFNSAYSLVFFFFSWNSTAFCSLFVRYYVYCLHARFHQLLGCRPISLLGILWDGWLAPSTKRSVSLPGFEPRSQRFRQLMRAKLAQLFPHFFSSVPVDFPFRGKNRVTCIKCICTEWQKKRELERPG